MRLERFKTLAASTGSSYRDWRVRTFPFARPLYDTVLLLTRIRTDDWGAPLLGSRALWAKIFDVAAPDETRSPAAPVDAAWLADAILAHDAHVRADRLVAILLLLFDTGVRCSEVCRLRLADVIDGDHLATSLTVHGKGDKYRRIEMHPQTQRAVFEYLVNERPQNVRSEAAFVRAARNRGGAGIHLRQAD